MDQPTEEERLDFVRSYGVEPVTDINTDLTFKDVGTAIIPSSIKVGNRKKWIGMGPKSSGKLYLDLGAANAIVNNRKSLLPSGIVKIEGSFKKGQQVLCVSLKDNLPIARGLISYNSDETNLIKGKKSSEIQKILGYKYSDEIINRDNMVLMQTK